MSRSFAEIAEEVLSLPQTEQFRLARVLLDNAETSEDLEAEAMWEAEIERRIQKIDAGLAKGVSFEEVLRKVDRRLGK